jgi:hypothetical protein
MLTFEPKASHMPDKHSSTGICPQPFVMFPENTSEYYYNVEARLSLNNYIEDCNSCHEGKGPLSYERQNRHVDLV